MKKLKLKIKCFVTFVRHISSLRSVLSFPSISDSYGTSISTQIIRRQSESTRGHPWTCYFYEILESAKEGGRDIVVIFRFHENGSLSTHHYRPFQPDRESLENLANLVSDPTIVCWKAFFHGCSSPFMAINFRSSNHPIAVAGCFVTAIISARNDDRLIYNARVLLPSPASQTRCVVPNCRMCRLDEITVFQNGDYIVKDIPPCRFVCASNNGQISFRFLRILEGAYHGNIVALHKGKVDALYLAVPPIYRHYKYGSVAVKFADFSLLFYPIPRQNCCHPLSAFFRSAILDDVWIPINEDPQFFFKRDPIPSTYLHLCRNLILLDVERRNAYNPIPV